MLLVSTKRWRNPRFGKVSDASDLGCISVGHLWPPRGKRILDASGRLWNAESFATYPHLVSWGREVVSNVTVMRVVHLQNSKSANESVC